jgi:hypothetical protein
MRYHPPLAGVTSIVSAGARNVSAIHGVPAMQQTPGDSPRFTARDVLCRDSKAAHRLGAREAGRERRAEQVEVLLQSR